jgi:hypothetical protein
MSTTPMSSPQHGKERLDRFYSRFPNTKALKIQPVTWGDQSANGGTIDGFDVDDVKGLLGAARFNLLMTNYVKALFCCGHRVWPTSHAEPTKRNAEVHCVYASDLEKFLKDGN